MVPVLQLVVIRSAYISLFQLVRFERLDAPELRKSKPSIDGHLA